MKNIIFNTSNDYDNSENSLIEINKDYNILYSKFGFGLLSKTNVFIGANNSGKSRFLRYLYSIDFDMIASWWFKKRFSMMYNDVLSFFSTDHYFVNSPYMFNRYREEEFYAVLNKHSVKYSKENKFYFPPLRGVKDYKTIIQNKLQSFSNSEYCPIGNKDLINFFNSLLKLHENGLSDFDIYKSIISHEYFNDDINLSQNIFTGGQLYKEIKKMLLGDVNDRKAITKFEIFLRDNFFSDYDVVQLIPNDTEKVLFVKIGDDEREIYNWGDGTQQLIIILYSLFKHKSERNCLFFIEEPETYLHPGILRKFIEVINSEEFENHQYFITTHSNAILDISADTNINMSIFKFKKVKNKESNDNKPFSIEQCNNGDVSLLNELGIRNSSVFLSNCSIWVEGITDRLYLKHYLDIYIAFHKDAIKFRENIDYTFIEYGGSNITHFNFFADDSLDKINANYINNKIFLIADGDLNNQSDAKKQRKEELKDKLKDNFYELNVNEIENLLSLDTIKNVLKKENPNQDNIIDSAFKNSPNYDSTYLGKFIDEQISSVSGSSENGIKTYGATSGTIKNKVKFCEDAISCIKNYDDLSDNAKILVEKIYNFIRSNNIN